MQRLGTDVNKLPATVIPLPVHERRRVVAFSRVASERETESGVTWLHLGVLSHTLPAKSKTCSVSRIAAVLSDVGGPLRFRQTWKPRVQISGLY